MTAAHCVYETSRRGNLLGVSRPSEIAVRVGSRNVANAALGTKAGVVAVLPQPFYRWDGSRHNHDVALLALDRAMPQAPAALAEQQPDAGKPLLIAGYGSTSTNDNTRPSALKEALIDAADPGSCTLVSESFDPSWLFCGAASTDPALPGGTSCYGDSGGPAFAYENTADNLVVEGIISYGSQHSCEYSRSYLVLVSSERGFIDRALVTAPQNWKNAARPPADGEGQGRPPQSQPAGRPRAAHRRRQEPPLARRHRLLHACGQAPLARLPQRAHESVGGVRPRPLLEAVLGLRLRAGLRRDEEAVERRVRGQRHRVTGAQVDRKRYPSPGSVTISAGCRGSSSIRRRSCEICTRRLSAAAASGSPHTSATIARCVSSRPGWRMKHREQRELRARQ